MSERHWTGKMDRAARRRGDRSTNIESTAEEITIKGPPELGPITVRSGEVNWLPVINGPNGEVWDLTHTIKVWMPQDIESELKKARGELEEIGITPRVREGSEDGTAFVELAWEPPFTMTDNSWQRMEQLLDQWDNKPFAMVETSY